MVQHAAPTFVPLELHHAALAPAAGIQLALVTHEQAPELGQCAADRPHALGDLLRRILLAVHPPDGDRGHVAAGRKLEPVAAAGDISLLDRFPHLGLDARRVFEVQRADRQVERVRPLAGEHPVAQVEPVLKLQAARVISALFERSPRRGSEPEIPVQTRRHRVLARRPVVARREAAVAIAPHVDLANLAEQSGLDDLDRAAERLAAAALGAVLRGDLALGRQFDQLACLRNLAHQRFFAEHVLAGLHEGHAQRRMPSRAGGHQHRVERLLGLQQLAVVLVESRLFCARRPVLAGTLGHELGGPIKLSPVDVAQGDHVVALAQDLLDQARAAASRADRGHVELVVGRLLAGGPNARGNNERRRQGADTCHGQAFEHRPAATPRVVLTAAHRISFLLAVHRAVVIHGVCTGCHAAGARRPWRDEYKSYCRERPCKAPRENLGHRAPAKSKLSIPAIAGRQSIRAPARPGLSILPLACKGRVWRSAGACAICRHLT